MPNVIVELRTEVDRVTGILAKLEGADHDRAHNAIRFAQQSLAMNNYEGMREAIDDLREFKEPK